MSARFTDSTFTPSSVRDLNKIIIHLQKPPTLELHCITMDISDMSLVVFSDSSFAKNEDLTSQLGYIVLLLGKTVLHIC